MRLARIPKYNYAAIFAHLPAELERTRDYYNLLWIGDLFERAQMMRGMEACLTDFYLNPGFLHELFDVLADLIVATIRAAGPLDLPAVFLSDDYGTQHGLFISRALWMEFIRPRLRRSKPASDVNRSFAVCRWSPFDGWSIWPCAPASGESF